MKNISKKKKVIIVSISLVILISIVSYILAFLVYKGSVGSSQKVKNEEVIEVFSQKEDKPLKKLESYSHYNEMIESSNGYSLESMFIKSNSNTKDTMIIVHGIERYYFDMLETAFNYLDNGFNVLIYNQRHTGKSGGDDYTFGFYERYDLDSIIKHVKKNLPNGRIGVHGYSMGAATAVMHSEINEKDKNVDFYIVDSPYHEMKDAIRLGIEAENIPLIPTSYISFVGNLYTKLKSGFYYDDVKPGEAVKNITVPMMLIHGTKDDVCAPESSRIIYNNIPHDKKEIWLVDGAKHIRSINIVGKEYYNRIFNFIKKNV